MVGEERGTGLWLGGGSVAAATAIAVLVEPLVSESDVIMVYVVAVTLAAHRLRLRASLLTALFSVLSFNFFFAQPRHTLYVHDTRYLLTFLALGGTGMLISSLAARAREQAAQSQELYRLTRRLAACGSPTAVAEVAADQVHRLLGAPVTLRIATPDGLALVATRGDARTDGVEDAAAQTSARSSDAAATDATTTARGRYLPLVREGRLRGVLGVEPTRTSRLDTSQGRRLLGTAVDLISEVLDRVGLEEQTTQARLAAETERARSTMLSSVSHDLRTPLATITGATTTLLDPRARLDDATRRALLERVTDEAARLERLVDNVLNMTRLDGVALALSLDWQIPHEVVGTAIARIASRAGTRPIKVRAPTEPALVRMDALLVEQAVANLLENALVHAPSGPLEVTVEVDDDNATIAVADHGPGLGDQDPEALFEKFARGRGARPGGAGLGLAIVRAIAELHGGTARARANEGSGARFEITLPRGGPDHLPLPEPEEEPR